MGHSCNWHYYPWQLLEWQRRAAEGKARPRQCAPPQREDEGMRGADRQKQRTDVATRRQDDNPTQHETRTMKYTGRNWHVTECQDHGLVVGAVRCRQGLAESSTRTASWRYCTRTADGACVERDSAGSGEGRCCGRGQECRGRGRASRRDHEADGGGRGREGRAGWQRDSHGSRGRTCDSGGC